MSGFEVFLNKGLTGFLFLGVQRINFGNLGYKGWFKVNGVVIGVMRREDVVCLLRERIREVFTPFG